MVQRFPGAPHRRLHLRHGRRAVVVQVVAEDPDQVPPLLSDVVPAIGVAPELRRVVRVAAPVILDGDPQPGVGEIHPGDEATVGGVDVDVQVGLGKAGTRQYEPQLGLFRRLRALAQQADAVV